MSLKKTLLSMSRTSKKLIVLVNDFISICIATLFALYISNADFFPLNFEGVLRLILIPLLSIIIFWYLGVYSSIVRYIDFSVIFVLVKAVSTTFLIILISRFIYIYFLGNFLSRTLDLLLLPEGLVVGFMASIFIVKSDESKGEMYFSFWIESLSIFGYLFLAISLLIF